MPNPIPNVGGTSSAPSLEALVQAMSLSTTVKVKAEEKPVKPPSAIPAAITTTETSVTPRQRPKGHIVVPAPAVGAGLLPPPKSPKPVDPQNHTIVASNSSLQIQPPPTPSATSSSNQLPSEIGHRRNASDSSAFEKCVNIQHCSSYNLKF